MVQWQKLSINARIALCLIYAEKMIPKIKSMIDDCDRAKKYAKGGQQIDDILDLAWDHLQDKGHVDWSEMYALCNEGHGWTNDVRYNLCGYFDYIIELNCSGDEDSITFSNMILYCFYYSMYHFAKRQNEKYVPEDMEWFGMKGSEEEVFEGIDKAVNAFMPFEERQKIDKLRENLCREFPFNQVDPYGKYIGREIVYDLLERQ